MRSPPARGLEPPLRQSEGKSKRAPVLLGLALLAPATAWPQSADQSVLRGFEAYVRDAVETWEVPGLAVAVVKDDSIVFAEFGRVR